MKLKKFVLKEGMNELLDSELKALRGGEEEEQKYVWCHCKGVEKAESATDCGKCETICGTGEVQNCNYVVAKPN